MKKFAFAFILIFSAYSLFSQTSAENEITESEVTESEENENSLAKESTKEKVEKILLDEKFYFSFDNGFALLNVHRIQKESKNSNFVWQDSLAGLYFTVKTKNLALCNLKLRMEGLYPFLHQFNGMKQFAKQTILYGFDFFLGPYEEWKPFKYLTFNFAPGIHYMYQLSDEYHLNYLGIALNAGVEFPVFERWTFLLDGTFSWDNANLGTNKDIQPFDYSWQWQTTLGVRYSRKHLNGLNR